MSCSDPRPLCPPLDDWPGTGKRIFRELRSDRSSTGIFRTMGEGLPESEELEVDCCWWWWCFSFLCWFMRAWAAVAYPCFTLASMFSSFLFCAASSSACLARYSLRETFAGTWSSLEDGGSLPGGCHCWEEAPALRSSPEEAEFEREAERLISPASVLSDAAMEIMFMMTSDWSPSCAFDFLAVWLAAWFTSKMKND